MIAYQAQVTDIVLNCIDSIDKNWCILDNENSFVVFERDSGISEVFVMVFPSSHGRRRQNPEMFIHPSIHT